MAEAVSSMQAELTQLRKGQDLSSAQTPSSLNGELSSIRNQYQELFSQQKNMEVKLDSLLPRLNSLEGRRGGLVSPELQVLSRVFLISQSAYNYIGSIYNYIYSKYNSLKNLRRLLSVV